MGETNHGNTVQSNLCKQSDENNTNHFLRFSPEKPNQTQVPNSEPQVDLCLRLSLGAVDSEYWKEKHLTRSSSVAGMVNKKVNNGKSNSDLPELFLSLTRSCSLPLENEKGQIKLKDWQAKNRMEAKQRMMEKQRRDREARQEEKPSAEAALVPPPPKSEDAARAVASAARSPVPCRAIVNVKMEEYGSAKRKREVHEFQGGRDEDIAAEKDAVNSQSLPKPKETEPVIQLSVPKLVNPPKKVGVSKGCFEDNGIDVMKQMPSVTTTGDGPNGRRIEGFLYRYTKGEVTIVCVCHGCFLSPGEFVKHAGGKDVANPMKLINVVPSF